MSPEAKSSKLMQDRDSIVPDLLSLWEFQALMISYRSESKILIIFTRKEKHSDAYDEDKLLVSKTSTDKNLKAKN